MFFLSVFQISGKKTVTIVKTVMIIMTLWYLMQKSSSWKLCCFCFLRTPDLIIEVAHPSITAEYGESFLDVADYMVLWNVMTIPRVGVWVG